MKRLVIVLLTASLLLGGLLVGAPAQGAAPDKAGAGVSGIAFGPCQDPGLAEAGGACGTLRVPLDYSRARGR